MRTREEIALHDGMGEIPGSRTLERAERNKHYNARPMTVRRDPSMRAKRKRRRQNVKAGRK